MKGKGCLSIFVLALVVGVVGAVIRFYGGKFIDQYTQTWAYSQTEPLLVGTWQGVFRDPDGVSKTLNLRIDVPLTDDERLARTSRKSRRRRKDKRAFDGVATVSSRLGREVYELNGTVDRTNDHQFSLDFTTQGGKYPVTPNFYINDTKSSDNQWRADQMRLTLRFAYIRPGGSSFYSSSDPRFKKTVSLELRRVEPAQPNP